MPVIDFGDFDCFDDRHSTDQSGSPTDNLGLGNLTMTEAPSSQKRDKNL